MFLLQGLLYDKTLLGKLIGDSENFQVIGWEIRMLMACHLMPVAYVHVGSQSTSTDELYEIMSLENFGLGRAKLLQSHLWSGIAASPDDITDGASSACLHDSLVVEERYSNFRYKQRYNNCRHKQT